MRQRAGNGLTLAEVLVSIVILTVGVLAMIGSTTAVDRLIDRGRRVTQAAQLGEQVLDSLRRAAGDGLRACSGLVSDPTGYARQSVRVVWEVGALLPGGDPFARQVQVILTYQADRRVLSDTITTLLRCDV